MEKKLLFLLWSISFSTKPSDTESCDSISSERFLQSSVGSAMCAFYLCKPAANIEADSCGSDSNSEEKNKELEYILESEGIKKVCPGLAKRDYRHTYSKFFLSRKDVVPPAPSFGRHSDLCDRDYRPW